MAVVGAGAISQQHLAHLESSPLTEIVGVCDLSAAAGRFVARRHGCDRSFTDLSEMLDVLVPDALHVLTPPWSHVPLVELALERGVHVVCEKPLAPTGVDVVRLFELAESRRCMLVEIQNYRFNDQVRAIDALVRGDAIGQVCEVDIRLAITVVGAGDRLHPIHGLPAGAVHDVITHLAYLLDHLSGHAEWSELCAVWAAHLGAGPAQVDDLDAILVGATANGPVHGRLRCSPLTGPEAFELTVRGDRGEVAAELYHPRLFVRRDRAVGPQLGPVVDHVANGAQLVRAGIGNLVGKAFGRSPYHGLARLLDETYEALGSGAKPPVTRTDVETAATLVDRLVAARPLTPA